ncbi:unnamed protein product [Trichobilharzia szidati]|nr:unnamed protein product [Trichobilharzia szidati]
MKIQRLKEIIAVEPNILSTKTETDPDVSETERTQKSQITETQHNTETQKVSYAQSSQNADYIRQSQLRDTQANTDPHKLSYAQSGQNVDYTRQSQLRDMQANTDPHKLSYAQSGQIVDYTRQSQLRDMQANTDPHKLSYAQSGQIVDYTRQSQLRDMQANTDPHKLSYAQSGQIVDYTRQSQLRDMQANTDPHKLSYAHSEQFFDLRRHSHNTELDTITEYDIVHFGGSVLSSAAFFGDPESSFDLDTRASLYSVETFTKLPLETLGRITPNPSEYGAITHRLSRDNVDRQSRKGFSICSQKQPYIISDNQHVDNSSIPKLTPKSLSFASKDSICRGSFVQASHETNASTEDRSLYTKSISKSVSLVESNISPESMLNLTPMNNVYPMLDRNILLAGEHQSQSTSGLAFSSQLSPPPPESTKVINSHGQDEQHQLTCHHPNCRYYQSPRMMDNYYPSEYQSAMLEGEKMLNHIMKPNPTLSTDKHENQCDCQSCRLTRRYQNGIPAYLPERYDDTSDELNDFSEFQQITMALLNTLMATTEMLRTQLKVRQAALASRKCCSNRQVAKDRDRFAQTQGWNENAMCNILKVQHSCTEEDSDEDNLTLSIYRAEDKGINYRQREQLTPLSIHYHENISEKKKTKKNEEKRPATSTANTPYPISSRRIMEDSLNCSRFITPILKNSSTKYIQTLSSDILKTNAQRINHDLHRNGNGLNLRNNFTSHLFKSTNRDLNSKAPKMNIHHHHCHDHPHLQHNLNKRSVSFERYTDDNLFKNIENKIEEKERGEGGGHVTKSKLLCTNCRQLLNFYCKPESKCLCCQNSIDISLLTSSSLSTSSSTLDSQFVLINRKEERYQVASSPSPSPPTVTTTTTMSFTSTTSMKTIFHSIP